LKAWDRVSFTNVDNLRAALAPHWEAPAKERTKTKPSGEFQPGIDPSPAEVREQIGWVHEFESLFANHPEHPFRKYDPWINTGFAFKLHFGDAGYDLWDRTFDANVDHDKAIAKWIGFDSVATEGCTTIGTWKRQVRELQRDPNYMFRQVLWPEKYPPPPSPSPEEMAKMAEDMRLMNPLIFR
jgi:hypothetical protein